MRASTLARAHASAVYRSHAWVGSLALESVGTILASMGASREGFRIDCSLALARLERTPLDSF